MESYEKDAVEQVNEKKHIAEEAHEKHNAGMISLKSLAVYYKLLVLPHVNCNPPLCFHNLPVVVLLVNVSQPDHKRQYPI